MTIARAILVGVLLVAAALVGLVAAGGWLSLPPVRQAVAVPGLGAPVRVTFDTDGVPWIRAGSDIDAAAALGFVHARDRMFQMDLMRRVASGRLSEVAGSAGLKLDMLTRTLGLRRRAAADLAMLPAHTAALLAAYSRGVNAWIGARGRRSAPEFMLLGRPEPWTPLDCLMWGKTMSLYLSGNYRGELTRLALARRIRPSQMDQLWPPQKQPLAPEASAASPGLTRLAARLDLALPRFPDAFTLPSTASNEWAVDGAHSATGAPLLAGDPHLSFGLPAIWYLARIDTPAGTLAGATAPGVPFLVIGRNARIAWTFTTTGTDTQDVFVETPVDADHYATPDGPRAYVRRDEVIHVLGGSDRVLHVRETRHGPVISDIANEGGTSDAAGDGAAEPVLAVAMASLLPGDTAPAGLDALNQARDVASALTAAPRITSPNQNLLVADARRIGMAVTGRVPVRRSGDGENAVDGASGLSDWTGVAQGAMLPQVVAPASGRLVNANERVAAADFPVFLGRDWFGDWRARRIRALLQAHPHASVDDFVAMQGDVTSVFAQQVLPVLRRVTPVSKVAEQSLALLNGWNGEMTRDAPQPLIFNAWMQRFAIALLDHAGVPISQGGPRLEFLASVLSGEEAGWCDGDCTTMLGAALEQSSADLARSQPGPPSGWRWGRAHRAIFAHAILGQVPLLGRLTVRRVAAAGDDATIDRGGMAESARPGFDDVHGPAYRGVYDLADLDRSRFMVAPGQSGSLFSAHSADLMRRWRDGGTILLDRAPHHIGATLRLDPAPSEGKP